MMLGCGTLLGSTLHPGSSGRRHSNDTAEALHEHFRRKLYENVAGGTGLSVIFRFAPSPGSTIPLPIDLDEADATAIIILADSELAGDQEWKDYVIGLASAAETAGLSVRLFPIAIERAGLFLEEQALRWDQWAGTPSERRQRLINELTYEFCRMLRHFLEHLRHPAEEESALESYLQKVQIFLSVCPRTEIQVDCCAVQALLGNIGA